MAQQSSAGKLRAAVAAIRPAPFFPPPPAWALKLFGDADVAEDRQIYRADSSVLISLRMPTANLSEAELENSVAQTYRTLRFLLASETAQHPHRIWNFVPDILGQSGDGLDRYMHFNAGRYREFIEWFGEDEFEYRVPAASAVGHDGHDFILHALCGLEPPKPIANPRQRAAHNYSKKFGPIPPCFSRAVLVNDDRQLIMAGTASIVDEATTHVNELRLQLNETRENIDALIGTAWGPEVGSAKSVDQLRIYFVRPEDKPEIESFARAAFPGVEQVELQQGHLCRRDLLVEIEGRATRC